MIPLELITMLGSGLLSGVMTLWSQSLKAKQQSHKHLMDKIETKNAAVAAARDTTNKGMQFTRRIITLSAVAAIVVWPKVVPVFWPEVPTIVGWTEWNPGFWFFTDGQDVVKWTTASKGLILTPLDTHLLSAIIGLYFGSSVVKNS